MTELERRSLLVRVEKLLDAKADRFACYPVAKADEARIACVGLPRPELDEGDVMIV